MFRFIFAELRFIHVCLLKGSQISLALIDHNCRYMKFVDTVMTEFGLEPAKVAVTMKCILNSDMPLITIKSGNNVLSYMVLKDMDHEISNTH